MEELRRRGNRVVPWTRPDYDLDDDAAAQRMVVRDRPKLVIHCAAWTDVDGCARNADLAMRRNSAATAELAAACAEAGAGLAFVSTNEVFDGRRTDGRGYVETDSASPINPYGASKLAGERAASEAFATGEPGGTADLWIVRTAWLFGPPGNDFPTKVVAAADRLAPAAKLTVVADEHGSPTYTIDLAPAVLDLVETAPGGLYHLAAPGAVSRFDVAVALMSKCRPGLEVEPISSASFKRASTPPAWGSLNSSLAASYGARLRPWNVALAEYMRSIC